MDAISPDSRQDAAVEARGASDVVLACAALSLLSGLLLFAAWRLDACGCGDPAVVALSLAASAVSTAWLVWRLESVDRRRAARPAGASPNP